jgi:hypothetical protein
VTFTFLHEYEFLSWPWLWLSMEQRFVDLPGVVSSFIVDVA